MGSPSSNSSPSDGIAHHPPPHMSHENPTQIDSSKIIHHKRIQIPSHVLNDAKPLWSSCFVGHFLGTHPHIGSIHAKVKRLWSPTETPLKITAEFISPQVVLFRLDDASIRNKIIDSKYWFISDVPLVVQRWSPSMVHTKPDLTQYPAWVEFTCVPDNLFSREGLEFLSDQVGSYQRLHPKTERCLRLDAARVLTVVNLKEPLPTELCLAGEPDHLVKVTYTRLPPHCDICEVWGHIANICEKSNKQPEMTKIQEEKLGLGSDSQSKVLQTENNQAGTIDEMTKLQEGKLSLSSDSQSKASQPETQQAGPLDTPHLGAAEDAHNLDNSVIKIQEKANEKEKLEKLLADLEDHLPRVSNKSDKQTNSSSDTDGKSKTEEWTSPKRPIRASASKTTTETSSGSAGSEFKVLSAESSGETEQNVEDRDDDTQESETESPPLQTKVPTPKKKQKNQHLKKKSKTQQKNNKEKIGNVGFWLLKQIPESFPREAIM